MRYGDVRCIDMNCYDCPLYDSEKICKVTKTIRSQGNSCLKPKMTIFNVLSKNLYLPEKVREWYKKKLNKEYKPEVTNL